MLAIVRIALNRPYTFVVMAMLIVIFGVTAAIKTPTDIFPNIGIPVVAVVGSTTACRRTTCPAASSITTSAR